MECQTSATCPFLYQCQSLHCVHIPLLTFDQYTVFVFLTVPIFVALANIAGVSSGFLKIILFMDFLDYPVVSATVKTYPIIFGGGLANFLLLIKVKHPFRDGPCINFNIGNIIIPGVTIGATFGSLTNALIPEFILDLITMILCLLLMTVFWGKIKQYYENRKITQGYLKSLLPERYKSPQKKATYSDPQGTLQLPKINEQEGQHSETQQVQSQQIQCMSPQRKTQLRNEVIEKQSSQWKQITFSLAIFAVVQFASLTLQGKVIPFSICQGLGGLYVSLLIPLLIIIQLSYYFFYIKPKYQKYVQFRILSEVDISSLRTVALITFGSFVAGFSTGLIGIGCGHITLLTLLYLNVNQKVAVATAGYQVVFIGAASTLQSLLFGYIDWQQVLFLSLLAFIGSLFLTIILRNSLQEMDDKGALFILIVLILLIVFSFIGIIVAMVLSLQNFGFQAMMKPIGLDC